MPNYTIHIFETCEEIHMSISGASEGRTDQELYQLCANLLERRNQWQPSHTFTSHASSYDSAVFNLMNAAFQEGYTELKKREAADEVASLQRLLQHSLSGGYVPPNFTICEET